jgi:fructokinase
MIYGGIEAGGTRWTCAVGNGEGELSRSETFPTTGPEETISRAVDFFLADVRPDAIGVGTFGPIEVRRTSPRWGRITTTPKPGWADTDVAAALEGALGVPIGFDTDVNAAALGEWRWGAARGLEVCCYITVGTGIGGGALIDGTPIHGLLHPEFGHMRIPHDLERDPFPGACPFHGDCLEGLASGEALRGRWGRPGEELRDERVWRLEAEYLALGLVNVVLTLSPERIVLGGGVSAAPGLIPLVRKGLMELSAGYIDLPQLGDRVDEYLVEPGLGSRAGVIGALELARMARG